MSYWQQFRVMFLWNIKNQRANPASILNPLLFSLTFIILFKVAFSHLERTESLALFCAQSFLVVMVGSQVALLGTFDQEAKDQLFELMQTSPLDYSAWYLAKYFGSLLLACFFSYPTIGFIVLADADKYQNYLSSSFLSLVLMALSGLVALGVLLSALTLRAKGREALFPLLYFPLGVPVLIASLQGSYSLLSPPGSEGSGEFLPWLGLLMGFSFIYLFVGLLCFEELFD